MQNLGHRAVAAAVGKAGSPRPGLGHTQLRGGSPLIGEQSDTN